MVPSDTLDTVCFAGEFEVCVFLEKEEDDDNDSSNGGGNGGDGSGGGGGGSEDEEDEKDNKVKVEVGLINPRVETWGTTSSLLLIVGLLLLKNVV